MGITAERTRQREAEPTTRFRLIAEYIAGTVQAVSNPRRDTACRRESKVNRLRST
jgi:hypothetical protein